MKTLAIIVCAIGMWASLGRAQQISVPAHTGVQDIPIGEDVYNLLRHLSVRGIIQGYSEASLPISEHDVVGFLVQTNGKDLSSSEREQIEKYLRTYTRTPYDAITVFPAESAEPFFSGSVFSDKDKYLYRWRDTSSHSDILVNFIGSLEYRHRMKPTSGSAVLGVIGGRIQGTLSGHVGYYMQTTNGQSFGDSSIALEDPVIGKNKNFAVYSNHTFYDFTSAEIVYNTDWFTGKLTRIPISFGGSYQQDNVTISPKALLYDAFSIGAHVGAVRYQAVFASLLGDGRFSANPGQNYNAFGAGAYIDPKFMALHHVNIALGNDFDFGFTDITIFSRRFDAAYLNPFAFLKSVEQFLNDRDNGLLAAHIRWRITNGLEFRGQGLMDDIVASKIGTGYWGNKFAWQAGVMWAAPLGLNDLDLAVEYTRVEPYTYTHFNAQNAFTTSGSNLGAGIGPNSISWWGMVRWAPTAKLTLIATAAMTARGENIYNDKGDSLLVNWGADVEQTIYNQGDADKKYHILDGRRVNIFVLGGEAKYELYRGFGLFAQVSHRSADYPGGAPTNSIQKPYAIATIGAKAVF